MATASKARTARPKPTGQALVQSVCRAFDILEVLGRSDAGLGVAELAREMALKTPTVHNLLQTLVARGYGEQDPESLRYRLGPAGYVLGRGSSRAEMIARSAGGEVDSLAARTGESAALGIWQGRGGAGGLVFVANVDSRHELAVRAGSGSVYTTACGMTLLAHMPDADRRDYIRWTPPPAGSLRRRGPLEKHLTGFREGGVTVLVKPDGVTAIAAPVRDRSGEVVAAIGASGPTIRLERVALGKLKEEVMLSAANVSRRLGYDV